MSQDFQPTVIASYSDKWLAKMLRLCIQELVRRDFTIIFDDIRTKEVSIYRINREKI